MSGVVAIIPIRDFDGMSRLSDVLSPSRRRQLSRLLADRVATATTTAGLTTMVITASTEVWTWAMSRGLAVGDDPRTDLSGAASSAVASAEGHPWLIVHADLPLVTPDAIGEVAAIAGTATVLVPSHDGGSNVIGGFGRFPFAYGPGSFHRHFSAVPDAIVTPSPRLSIDIDTPAHLASFPEILDLLTADG